MLITQTHIQFCSEVESARKNRYTTARLIVVANGCNVLHIMNGHGGLYCCWLGLSIVPFNFSMPVQLSAMRMLPIHRINVTVSHWSASTSTLSVRLGNSLFRVYTWDREHGFCAHVHMPATSESESNKNKLRSIWRCGRRLKLHSVHLRCIWPLMGNA